MYLFLKITCLPKLDTDGADFNANLEVEQGYPDTHLMKNHNLSDDTHPIKKYQIV